MRVQHISSSFHLIKTHKRLLILMSVLSETFFPFMSRHLMSLSFFTAWHNLNDLKIVII